MPVHFKTWYILPSPCFSAMALLPFCSSASLQAHAPPKTLQDGDTHEEDIAILLPYDMKETWVQRKQTGHHACMLQRLGSPVTVTQGRWQARTWVCMLACYKVEETGKVFAFHSWAPRKSCWRCQATMSPGFHFAFRDATLRAAWSAHISENCEFFFVQRASGICPSTFFQSPHLSVDTVMIQCLHTMDQGMLGDVIWTSTTSPRGHNTACVASGVLRKGPRG